MIYELILAGLSGVGAGFLGGLIGGWLRKFKAEADVAQAEIRIDKLEDKLESIANKAASEKGNAVQAERKAEEAAAIAEGMAMLATPGADKKVVIQTIAAKYPNVVIPLVKKLLSGNLKL